VKTNKQDTADLYAHATTCTAAVVLKLEGLSGDMENRLPSTRALLSYAADVWFDPLLELTTCFRVVEEIRSFCDRRSGRWRLHQWLDKESDKEKILDFKTQIDRIVQRFGVSSAH
jgi:hypothetical protein